MKDCLYGISLASLALGMHSPAVAQGNQSGSGDQSLDIVVTAQRRSESVQEVPISVSAITPLQLEQFGLRKIDDLQMLSPGLVFNSGYVGYSQTYIRGIGAASPSPGLEVPVAIYIDGMYVARSQGAILDVLDAASVQVLKGPQGTLYGRNATGGAIIINTAEPDFKPSLRFVTEYGRLNHALGEAVANVPLSDNLAFRAAARINYTQGYVHNLVDGRKLGGRKSYTIRGKLRWEATDTLSATLSIQYDKTDERQAGFALREGGVACLPCLADPTGTVRPLDGFYESDNDGNRPFVSNTTSTYLHIKQDGDMLAIEGTMGYRNLSFYTTSDQDFSRLPLFHFFGTSGGKTYSGELQAYSKGDGWLNGLVGVGYQRDNGWFRTRFYGASFDPLAAIFGENPGTYNRVITKSVTAFGELYLTPVERLKFTIGGRYSRDTRHLTVWNNAAGAAAFTAPGSPANFDQHASFNSFTPRFVIAYDAGDVNLYASYNKGFKAGGYNTPSFTSQAVIRPEKIDGYEAGAKYVSPDRRLRANLALFYYNYSDVQVGVVDLASGG